MSNPASLLVERQTEEVKDITQPKCIFAPSGVVSLVDMLRFYAVPFTAAIANLERAEAGITLLSITGDPSLLGFPASVGANPTEQVKRVLLEVIQCCAELPISYSLSQQLQRAHKNAELGNDVQRHMTMSLIQELKHNILNELGANYFLLISGDIAKRMILQDEPLFGTEVEDYFGDANTDIVEAGKCMALDRWTACVFHLMRVLEHGLKKAANRFQVSTEKDSWHKVIKGIEDGLDALRNKGSLSAQDHADITFYSEVTKEFRNFKDAWRNHATHGRDTYDETQALNIFKHTRDFMRMMAKGQK